MRGNRNKPVKPEEFTTDLVSVPDLHATILNALGVDFSEENITPIGRPLAWSDGTVVSELLQS